MPVGPQRHRVPPLDLPSTKQDDGRASSYMTGEISKRPPLVPPQVRDPQLPPCLWLPLPLPTRLLTLELPQAEALQAPGQAGPSHLHPATSSKGTCLDSPNTTGGTDPRQTGCKGQSGHSPRQAGSGPAPTPCPAALTWPTGRWLQRPELLAQRWRDQGHCQADELSAKSSQAWNQQGSPDIKGLRPLPHSLKAGPRLLLAPPLTKAKAWHHRTNPP